MIKECFESKGLEMPEKDQMKELKDILAEFESQERVEILPEPGFVIKTYSSENKKIFINLCLSPLIPMTSNVNKIHNGKEETGLNIPLSLGPLRKTTDKKSLPCLLIDIIVNPEVLEDIRTDKTMQKKIAFYNVCLEYIEKKHELLLSRKLKFPRLKYKYENADKTIPLQYINASRVNKLNKVSEISESVPSEVAPSVSVRQDATIKLPSTKELNTSEGSKVNAAESRKLANQCKCFIQKYGFVLQETEPLPVMEQLGNLLTPLTVGTSYEIFFKFRLVYFDNVDLKSFFTVEQGTELVKVRLNTCNQHKNNLNKNEWNFYWCKTKKATMQLNRKEDGKISFGQLTLLLEKVDSLSCSENVDLRSFNRVETLIADEGTKQWAIKQAFSADRNDSPKKMVEKTVDSEDEEARFHQNDPISMAILHQKKQ